MINQADTRRLSTNQIAEIAECKDLPTQRITWPSGELIAFGNAGDSLGYSKSYWGNVFDYWQGRGLAWPVINIRTKRLKFCLDLMPALVATIDEIERIEGGPEYSYLERHAHIKERAKYPICGQRALAEVPSRVNPGAATI